MEATDKVAWGKAVALLNVVLIVVVAVAGFRYSQRSESSPDRSATDASAAVASSDPTPGATEPDPAASPAPGPARAPEVGVQLRSDFTRGDEWPVGAGFRESGSVAWPLGVVDGVMKHGAPTGGGAVSWLERYTTTDVRRIGARVQWAPNHSGSVALTAWHTSVLDKTGSTQPRTGMRLVAEPGAWRLVALEGDGPAVLAEGTWEQRGRGASFDLVRRGQTLWLTDPSGTVSTVTDPRVTALSGPWASWELREADRGSRPAALHEIWAG